MQRPFHLLALCGIGMLLPGCTRVPAGLEPVTGFDSPRYLGKWYEIARLDHSFERGLTNVTAEYAARPGGGISVLNRGYDPGAGKWREARAVARFRGDHTLGSLKVCFFWPFWGGYHILALDEKDYGYALVTSSSRSYLWILSREPRLAPEVLSALVARAQQWGFATEELITVEQRPLHE
jgi:apolipoprotein D and lipocalin family protein